MAMLGLVMAAAAEACAAQTQQRASVYDGVAHLAEYRGVNPAESAQRAREVVNQTTRMERLSPDTLDALATEVAQHQNPEAAQALRRVRSAREVGNRVRAGDLSAVSISQTLEERAGSLVVTSIEGAQAAYANAFQRRAEGAQWGHTSADIAFGLTHLYQQGTPEAQVRFALSSGLMDTEDQSYREMARVAPQVPVDLSRAFTRSELTLLATYVEHSNARNYFTQTANVPPLTGESVLQGQIPLTYASQMFAAVAAIGGLSGWEGMTRTMPPAQQEASRLLNLGISLKLAEALALFQHDVQFANGETGDHAARLDSSTRRVSQVPYTAWGVIPNPAQLYLATDRQYPVTGPVGGPTITAGMPIHNGAPAGFTVGTTAPRHHGHQS